MKHVVNKIVYNSPSWIFLYRRLLSYVLPHKWTFLVALVGMLVVAICDTTFAWLLQPIMDDGLVGRDRMYIFWIPITIIFVVICRTSGEFVDRYYMSLVSRHVIKNLRQQMYEKLLCVPASYYDNYPHGNLVSRLTYDVEQVANVSSGAFRSLFQDSIKAIFLLILMFYLSWKLSLVFLLVFPPAFLVFKISSKKFRRISSLIQKSVGDIAHVATEAFLGQRIVKIYGAYEHEKQAFSKVNNRNLNQSMRKAVILSASVPLTLLLMGVSVAGVVWLALILKIQPGVFTSYLVSITMMIRPIKNISKLNETIQTGVAGAESIFYTIDLPMEEDLGMIEFTPLRERIMFQNISFRYKSDSVPILNNVSFEIFKGQTVALVGASGSGKSTIAALLLRLYNPNSGTIRIDGLCLKKITLSSLRSNVTLISQDVIIFDDTIRHNIAYGTFTSIDENRLINAARLAHILEFVESMKDGFDTIVGEGGIRLSGGQRQRISIARALYKNTAILIMDEATSSLDNLSEQYIQSAIHQLVKNRTTLMITHRLSTVEKADKILVLDHAQLIEQGTHTELMKKKGAYYRLYHASTTCLVKHVK